MNPDTEQTIEDYIGAAFMCGLEHCGVIEKEEIKHRIEAFEHSRGYKELVAGLKNLIEADRQRAVEEAIQHRLKELLERRFSEAASIVEATHQKEEV